MKMKLPEYLTMWAKKEERTTDHEPSFSSLEKKLDRAISQLGERWLLHPAHSPKKGVYNQWGKLEEAS